jgi:hypothetical protein
VSVLNPTIDDVRNWLEVIARPVDEEARAAAKSLVLGAFLQSESAAGLLARELVNLRATDSQKSELLQKSVGLLERISRTAPPSPPLLRLVR